MTTEQGNKLIAEFLGWKHRKSTEHPHVFPNGVWDDVECVGHPNLTFHLSWDCIIPVAAKIKGTPMIKGLVLVQTSLWEVMEDALVSLDISKVWLASARFIEFLNNHQKH